MSPPPGVSVSTIAATATATECHMLKIQGYKRLKKLHRHGQYVESCAFEAAGHTWRIEWCPNGEVWHQDFISLYLVLLDGGGAPADDLHAEIKFSLVRQPGALGALWPAHSWSRTVIFNRLMMLRGCPRFISREQLERSPAFLRDDCFAVRCDITVIGKAAAAEPAVQAGDLERLGMVCYCRDELCKKHHVRTASGVMWLREAFVKFFLGCFRV